MQSTNVNNINYQDLISEKDVKLVRNYIGAETIFIISDKRIQSMLKLTKQDVRETCKMSLSYVINTLKLQNTVSEECIQGYKNLLDTMPSSI